MLRVICNIREFRLSQWILRTIRNTLWQFRLGQSKLGELAVCKDGSVSVGLFSEKRCALFTEAMAVLNKEGSGVAEKALPQTCNKSHVGFS